MKYLAKLAVFAVFFSAFTTGSAIAEEKIKVLLIDGQNNHRWQETSPVLQRVLEKTGRFTVEVATSPPKGEDLSKFRPKFANFDVVVSNYNGDPWSDDTKADFTKFVAQGGGFVCVHAADNSFPEWPEYNEMIGLGGWGGRNETSGPYVRFRDGKIVKQAVPGRGGSHGKRHEFIVALRNAEHPITQGLPSRWLHTADELYDRLRGPAKNLTVLATAYSDPSTGGTGEHEPSLMTIDFGKGRVFHTTQGHDLTAMKCAGFQFVLQRGTEWAATGKVTLTKVPADFPDAEASSSRDN